jgi:hypothetical protein
MNFYKGIICCKDIRVLLRLHRIVHFSKLKAIDIDTYYFEIYITTKDLDIALTPFEKLYDYDIDLSFDLGYIDYEIMGMFVFNEPTKYRPKNVYVANESGAFAHHMFTHDWGTWQKEECRSVQEYKFFMNLGEGL